jgi:ATP-dependent RNA helicase DHX36
MMFQVEATIEYICRNEGSGAILVFLTGWDEISKLLEKLEGNNFLGNRSKFLILPIHGSMPTIDQCEIFDRPPPNKRQACFFFQILCHSQIFVVIICLEMFVKEFV